MPFKIMPILCLQFITSLAFPGGDVSKHIFAVRHAYNEYRMLLRPFDVLDNFYVKYFSSNENEMLATKIIIHSHIFMLKRKIEQLKEKMPKSKYDQLKYDIERLFVKTFFEFEMGTFTLNRFYSLALCHLLEIKFDLFKAVNKTDNEGPKCDDQNKVLNTFIENFDQISEWMLSDLMRFWPKRPKLVAFLKDAVQKGEEGELRAIRLKFVNLIGFARFALIYKTHLQNIGMFVGDRNFPYALLYKEFLLTNTKLGKWRVKIVLQKYLYDEWAKQFFGEEITKAEQFAANKSNNWPNLTAFQQKINFIIELKQIWFIYSLNFWFNEKIIRDKMHHFVKKNNSKNLRMAKETLAAHFEEINGINLRENELGISLLWENGPEDTSLFRALSICIREAIAEYAQKLDGNSSEMKEFSLNLQLKMLICAGKILKKTAPRKDQIIAKLNFEKVKKLIGSDFEDCALLSEKSKLWGELFDLEGIGKLKAILLAKTEYLSANENFTSSDDSSSAAENDGIFEDANSEESVGEENEKEINSSKFKKIIEKNSNEISVQNMQNKWPTETKNATKNNYGRKERKKANAEKKKQLEAAEEQKGEDNSPEAKAQKYYTKIAKNKKHKKRN